MEYLFVLLTSHVAFCYNAGMFIDKTERCLIQPSDRTSIDRSRAGLDQFLHADSVRITEVYRVERRDLEEEAEAIASMNQMSI